LKLSQAHSNWRKLKKGNCQLRTIVGSEVSWRWFCRV